MTPRPAAPPPEIEAKPRRRYAPGCPELRREQLLDAALEVIVERGYSGVSIEAIAREAGVTAAVSGKPEKKERAATTADILDLRLGYTEARGTEALRRSSPGTYQNTSPDEILVTTGAIEANYLLFNTLLDAGDHIVTITPRISNSTRSRTRSAAMSRSGS